MKFYESNIHKSQKTKSIVGIWLNESVRPQPLSAAVAPMAGAVGMASPAPGGGGGGGGGSGRGSGGATATSTNR